MPSALRRAVRDPTRLVAAGLLCVVIAGAGGIQTAAARALDETVRMNSRGIYDVLVTSEGSPEAVPGLLAPDSLLATAPGLELADVDAIRAIDGVDVAAPIGQLTSVAYTQIFIGGEVGDRTSRYRISLPLDSVAAEDAPQAYRLTSTFRTDDGAGARVAGSANKLVVVDESGAAPSAAPPLCTVQGYDLDPERYPALCADTIRDAQGPRVTVQDDPAFWWTFSSVVDDQIVFDVGISPQVLMNVTLVDPEAERALLGVVGDFLTPLQEIQLTPELSGEAIDAWAETSTSDLAAEFSEQRRQEQQRDAEYASTAISQELDALYRENGEDPSGFGRPPGRFLPVVLVPSVRPPLSVDLEVEELGTVQSLGDSGFPYSLPDGLDSEAPGRSVGSSSVDASGLLDLFDVREVTVPWPGTQPIERAADSTVPFPELLGAGVPSGARYERLDDAEVRVDARGFRDPLIRSVSDQVGPFALEAVGGSAGQESAYSEITALPQGSGFISAIPVGETDGQSLADLRDSLSAVPIGPYDVLDAAPKREAGSMSSGVADRGLGAWRSDAVASLSGAAAFGQVAPVNAVRVRVDAETGSDALSARILRVSDAIESLGHSVTVVSGTSPVPVSITATDHAYGVDDPDAGQEVASLAGIEEQWFELGAVARADTAISASTLAAVGVALGTVSVLLGAMQFASIPRRRAQAAVMRTVGWPSRRIRVWMAAEEAPGVVSVVVVGAVAIHIAGATPVAVGSALIGLVVLVGLSAVAIAAASAPTRPGRRLTRGSQPERRARWAVESRSVRRFGMRQSVAHRASAVTGFASVVLVGFAAAATVLAYINGAQAAGSSSVARVITDQAALPQLLLGLTALVAGTILCVLGRRIDARRRAVQWTALTAMGWLSREVRLAQRTESLTVTLPAVVLATATTFAVAAGVAAPSPAVLTAVAAAAGLLSALVLTSSGQRTTA